MIEAELAPEEARRIATLHALNVLDTPVEERFDRITRAAARLLDVPIAAISLLDTDREWFKSCVGLDLPEVPRDASFCAYAIRQDEFFVVKDTRFVPRFANNPLVKSDPRVRFYAGCPLSAPDGGKLGALCVMDRSPRQLSAGDIQTLRDMATWAEHELNVGNLAPRAPLADSTQPVDGHVPGGSPVPSQDRTPSDFGLLLKAIVDNMAEGIITFNERGGIVSLNPAAEHMFRYASREVRGQSIKRLIPMPFRAENTGHLTSRLLEGDTSIMGIHGEVTGRRKDGTTFPIDISVSEVMSGSARLAGHKLYLCIVHDITVQLAAERALRDSEELYGAVIATLDEGVILQDAQGIILAANAGAERILELPADQLIGKAPLISRWRPVHEDGEAFPVESHPSMLALQTGEAQFNVVMGLRMPNGSLKWVSVNSRPCGPVLSPESGAAPVPESMGESHASPASSHEPTSARPATRDPQLDTGQAAPAAALVVSSIRDITERKAAEREWLRARERYITLCDNVSDFVSMHDPKGVYLEASMASMELLGYTPQELIKANILGQIHPEDSPLITEAFRMLVGMGANCNIKYRIKRKSDEYIWLRTHARAVIGTHTGDAHILCISHKVRERRNMQAEALTRDRAHAARGRSLPPGPLSGPRPQTPLRDELTSLLNRRAIEELLNFKLASPRTSNYPFGCLILDIDHFDAINNVLGRSVGDAVLQELGRLLVQSCRAEDYVARYGEDQFIIVLPNTDAAGTVLVAERIVNTVRVANLLQGSAYGPSADPIPDKVTVSMGGTCIRRPSDLGLAELIQIIGSQLNEAKAMGRDRFVMNARETARQIESRGQ